MWTITFIYALLFSACNISLAQVGKSTITTDPDKRGGSLTMSPPDLNDEDSQANYMPSDLRCDACNGIALRFSNEIQATVDKYKSVREGKSELSEERVMEIFESICSDTEWNNFGVKEHDGVKRLTYPGSVAEKTFGIMQGGGPWPRRLSDMCHTYVGEHDEQTIYETHREKSKSGVQKLLCSKVCKTNKKSKKAKKQKVEL